MLLKVCSNFGHSEILVCLNSEHTPSQYVKDLDILGMFRNWTIKTHALSKHRAGHFLKAEHPFKGARFFEKTRIALPFHQLCLCWLLRVLQVTEAV
jgi:hypothetical protein